MNSCCTTPPSTDGTNKFFSRWSKTYEKQFRKKGLAKEQRLLLIGVREEPIAASKILDIGCGVGALHLTLLREGAGEAVGVDIAQGMLDKAQEFAVSMGLAEKVSYVLGDFAGMADSLQDADITTLDKVVCCYENLDLLLETSTGKTRRVYALTHPRDNLLLEFMFKTHIAFNKLFRMKFRPYWHNWQRMRDQIVARGFRLTYENSTLAWQVLVFTRG
jgi:magnesium-protoporphyrin O-methyltransferase